MTSDFEEGMLTGLLVGEGHFGGDGRQPQVTLRMHERHDLLFRWLQRTFPGGRLYGPYEHGGRRYYQWMARGAYLREELVPMLRRSLSATLDRYAHGRFVAMCERYARQLALPDRVGVQEVGTSPDRRTAHAQAARIFAVLHDTDVARQGSATSSVRRAGASQEPLPAGGTVGGTAAAVGRRRTRRPT